MALSGDRVLYPFSDTVERNWTQVAALDISTGKAQVVAHSAWDAGLVNWVAGIGDWVGWTDQSERQSDGAANVLWRVWVQNLRTGQKVLLSSSGDRPDPYVPVLSGQDGYLFWTQAESDRSARELVWRPGWKAPRDLLRHVEMTPGSETASDGNLVFLSTAAGQHRGHTIGGDCWTVPLDSSENPRPLTHTALAMGCAASDSWLVWTLHIDPRTKPLPADGVLDDPYEVKASRLSERDEQLVHRGYLSMGFPVTGDGFTVLPAGGTSLLVQSLTSKGRFRLSGGVDQLSMAAGDGELLAYVTYKGLVSTVHVVHVAG